MADETKKDQRVKAPVLRAKYKSRTLDEFIEKYSRDISRSGMWIKSAKPPALATLLKVEIQLEDGTPVISAVGRVVKRREEAEATPDAPAGMGIFFMKIDEQSQPVIDRIVALKGEDAGPHFENIRTGQTMRPPSDVAHSAFFGTTNPAQQMPAEADRTMMRQMNALLGEALRQVNEASPRKPNDAAPVPTQKATIMGVAAPQELLEKAIAASREESRKADEGPTKVATRTEIDSALEKLKNLEDTEAPKVEAPKAEAPKTEPTKGETKKPEAPKIEAKKVEPTKSEAKKPDAPKVEAKKSEAPKPEEPKTEERKLPRSLPPRQATKLASIPPPPMSRAVQEEVVKATDKPDEPKNAEAKTTEAKAEEKATETKTTEAKTEEKATEAKATEAKTEEKATEAKAEVKATEEKATEAKATEVKTEEKTTEAKSDDKKVDPGVVATATVKTDEKTTPEVKADEKKAPEAKPDEKKMPAPPPDEGMNVFVVIGVIALVAFLLYYFLLRGTG